MRRYWVLLAVAVASANASAAPEAAEIGECRPADLLGYTPSEADVTAHRIGTAPSISYAEGLAHSRIWGFHALLRVDESGQVRCYQLKQDFAGSVELNFERRAWLRGLSALRYQPFLDDGKARAAIVTESVPEFERPATAQALPDVPLHQVRITLERSGCYGSCPSYRVSLSGDGQVSYTGHYYVDVDGEHHYQIPAAAVAQLLESLRQKDLWSAKPEYRAPITDNPTYTLTLEMGPQRHAIIDYAGEMVGMPVGVSEFEREIDALAGTQSWIRLGSAAVEALDAEGFDFRSAAATAMLWRAVSNRGASDDRSILRLLQLGVRADGPPPTDQPVNEYTRLLDAALANHRVDFAAALIDAHALETAGKPDQILVDSAFRAALIGGRLAGVTKVWNAAGATTRPALSFDDTGPQQDQSARRVPVSLLLDRPYDDPGWEGLQITQWLAEQGCDLHAAGADGRTLLHIAADSRDPDFVRYLLDQGLDANAPGAYGLPALGSADNEEVAMLLLEAGTDLTLMGKDSRFREFANGNHWQRVITWLDAHAAP
jgi:hypothetical protein